MRIATIAGILFVAGVVAVVAAVATGAAEPTTLVLGVFLAIGGTIAFVFRHLLARAEGAGRRVRELPERGIRRRGHVSDVVPYGARHGGAVMHPEGVLMILRVDMAAQDGMPARNVNVLVVEPTDAAKARLGTDVVVLQHPDEPDLLALEGHLPGGRRLGLPPLSIG